MPTLKLLTCSIELAPSDTKVTEHSTQYGDGCVETFIAVPAAPMRFSVLLEQDGYIAPGLAMFVFIDGVYQCNRNRRGLLMPADGVPKKHTQTEFRVRQKEEKCRADGKFIGRDWTFEALKLKEANNAADLNPNFLCNVGTIEVVVLRCKDEGEDVPTPVLSCSKTMQHGVPAAQLQSTLARPTANIKSKAKAPSNPKPVAPSNAGSGGLGGIFGIFDGANDFVFGLDGANDEPLFQTARGTDDPLVFLGVPMADTDGAGDPQYQFQAGGHGTHLPSYQPAQPHMPVNNLQPWQQATNENIAFSPMPNYQHQQQDANIAFATQGVDNPNDVFFNPHMGQHQRALSQLKDANWNRDDRPTLYNVPQVETILTQDESPRAQRGPIQGSVVEPFRGNNQPHIDGHDSRGGRNPQIVNNQFHHCDAPGNRPVSQVGQQVLGGAGDALHEHQRKYGQQQQQPGYGALLEGMQRRPSMHYNQQQSALHYYGQPSQQPTHGAQPQKKPDTDEVDPNLVALLQQLLNPAAAQQQPEDQNTGPGLPGQHLPAQAQDQLQTVQQSQEGVPDNRTVDRATWRREWDLPSPGNTPRGSSCFGPGNQTPRWKRGQVEHVTKKREEALAEPSPVDKPVPSPEVEHFAANDGQAYMGHQQQQKQIGQGGNRVVQGHDLGHQPPQNPGASGWDQQVGQQKGHGSQSYNQGGYDKRYGQTQHLGEQHENGGQRVWDNNNANQRRSQQGGVQGTAGNGSARYSTKNWNQEGDNKDGNSNALWNAPGNANQDHGNGKKANWVEQHQQTGKDGSWGHQNQQKRAGDKSESRPAQKEKTNTKSADKKTHKPAHKAEKASKHDNLFDQQQQRSVGNTRANDTSRLQKHDDSGGCAADNSSNVRAMEKVTKWDDGKAKKSKPTVKDGPPPPKDSIEPIVRDFAAPPKDPIKPYFKDWQSPQAPVPNQAGAPNTKKKCDEPRNPYTHSEAPLPILPKSHGNETGISYGVQPGKGAVYSHRCDRPVYLDAMDKPYAVFSFKYRSKDVLEDMLGYSIVDDVNVDEMNVVRQVSEKARLLSLGKEELVEKLLKARGKAKTIPNARTSPRNNSARAQPADSQPADSQPRHQHNGDSSKKTESKWQQTISAHGAQRLPREGGKDHNEHKTGNDFVPASGDGYNQQNNSHGQAKGNDHAQNNGFNEGNGNHINQNNNPVSGWHDDYGGHGGNQQQTWADDNAAGNVATNANDGWQEVGQGTYGGGAGGWGDQNGPAQW